MDSEPKGGIVSVMTEERYRKSLVRIGRELHTLTKEDEAFILDRENTVIAAERRLVTARKRSIECEIGKK